MTKDDAMKLALEALGIQLENSNGEQKYADAIKALAQPEQEPVDFTSLLNEAEAIVRGKPVWKRFIDGTPLSNDIAVWMTVFAQDVARRTSPPAQRTWVGLTDEDFIDLCEDASNFGTGSLIRHIEAKLKEKNT